jgi:hypothetical protein
LEVWEKGANFALAFEKQSNANVENEKLLKKNQIKIWSIQKMVVTLQRFSLERQTNIENTYNRDESSTRANKI